MRGVGEVLVGPELAGAGESALDFVVDEDGADFRAAVSEVLEELGGGDVDATFSLNRLDYDAAGIFGDEVVDAGFVIVGPVSEAWQHRRKTVADISGLVWRRGCPLFAHEMTCRRRRFHV